MVQFWIKSVAEVVAERWNVVQENTQVEVLPVVDLRKKSARRHFFCGRCNTGVYGAAHALLKVSVVSGDADPPYLG